MSSRAGLDGSSGQPGAAGRPPSVPRCLPVADRGLLGGDELGLDVVDLVFDSLVDVADGVTARLRRLRFEGTGARVEADVRGCRLLAVQLRIEPATSVSVEAWHWAPLDPCPVRAAVGKELASLRPGLTSFLIRWGRGGRRPARTAWVPL